MTKNFIIDLYNAFDESYLGAELLLDNGEIRDAEGNEYVGSIVILGLHQK